MQGIQIQVAPPGPPGMMEMSIFMKPNQEIQMLQQQHHLRNQQLLQQFGQQGMDYWQQMNQYHNQFYQTSGLQVAETLVEVGLLAQGEMAVNLIPVYNDIVDLRMAMPQHQDYLMANPVYRRLYLDGRAEGYADTYDNPEGNVIGLQHQAYRAVVHGMGNWEYEENPEEWYFRECFRDEMDTRPDLKLKEKLNAINAWAIQNAAIALGQDPGSIDGFDIRPDPQGS